MKPKAILTFDLEFWYNDLLLEKHLPKDRSSLPDHTEEMVIPILSLLKKYGAKATFFVLGELAGKHPALVKNISEEGHEIASHGYSHTCLWDLNEESFEKEIRSTNQTIRDITGGDAKGFRAPNFSLNRKNNWAFSVLQRNGFLYDSSIFPLKTPLYGESGAPLGIYKVSDNFTEFPVSVFRKGLIKVPVGGGFYFRVIPFFAYVYLLKKIAKERIPVLYLHPHELFPVVPSVKGIPWLLKIMKFYGVKNSLKKLKVLLDNFDFISVQDYLATNKI